MAEKEVKNMRVESKNGNHPGAMFRACADFIHPTSEPESRETPGWTFENGNYYPTKPTPDEKRLIEEQKPVFVKQA